MKEQVSLFTKYIINLWIFLLQDINLPFPPPHTHTPVVHTSCSFNVSVLIHSHQLISLSHQALSLYWRQNSTLFLPQPHPVTCFLGQPGC